MRSIGFKPNNSPLANKYGKSYAELYATAKSGDNFFITEKNVCVVESEQSAVVLSELFPESIWMAYATTAHLSPDLFAPLQNRTVTIYPRTDSMMNTYLFFHVFASLICKRYPSITLRIDSTLENHATASQKERCIDILDFIQNT